MELRAERFSWFVPLIIVLEVVEGTLGWPLSYSLAFAALLLGTTWLRGGRTASGPPVLESPSQRLGWVIGGVVCHGGTLLLGRGAIGWLGDPLVLSCLLAPWVFVLAGSALTGARLGPMALRRLAILVALTFLGLMASGTPVQKLAVVDPRALVLPVSAVALLVALSVVERLPHWPLLLLVTGLGLTLRASGLSVWDPNPAVRDMLPLVLDAQDSWLAGSNPYHVYSMQRGSEVPLTYLPGLWLLSLPARLLFGDVRVIALVADVVIVGSLSWVANSNRNRAARDSAHALVLAFATAWFFSPSVQWNAIYAEAHAWWGLLALLLASALLRRFWMTAILLGCALATRHFALVLAPFVAWSMVHELGWRAALPRLAAAGATAAALLVWFVAPDPNAFWFGTVRWLWQYGSAHADILERQVGFANVWRGSAVPWSTALQLGALGACLLGAVKARTGGRIVACLLTCYLLVVMLNRLVWSSFYLDIAVLLALSRCWQDDATPRVHAAPTRRALGAGAVAMLGAGSAAAWLCWSLVHALSPPGQQRARAALGDLVSARDLILDRSDWRVGFVEGSWLLPNESSRKVVGELFAPALLPEGPFAHSRLWVATRTGRDDELRWKLSELASPKWTQNFGDFRLQLHELPRVTGRLATLLQGAEVSVRRGAASLPVEQLDRRRWRGPDFVEVFARRCAIGGADWPMIFVHPLNGGDVTLTFPAVTLRDRLVLFAGIIDRVVHWRRASSQIDVTIDGKHSGRLEIPNRRGMVWVGVDTTRSRGKVAEVALRVVTENDAQRWLCVDAVALERRPE